MSNREAVRSVLEKESINILVRVVDSANNNIVIIVTRFINRETTRSEDKGGP